MTECSNPERKAHLGVDTNLTILWLTTAIHGDIGLNRNRSNIIQHLQLMPYSLLGCTGREDCLGLNDYIQANHTGLKNLGCYPSRHRDNLQPNRISDFTSDLPRKFMKLVLEIIVMLSYRISIIPRGTMKCA